MPKTQEEKEEFIRMKKKEINDYIRSLKAMLCLRDFVIKKMDGEFYFGGALNYVESEERDAQTPDIISKVNDSTWVGEIKRSLANLNEFANKEEYIKQYIEDDIIAQLKKYDEPFKELKVDKHDLILMAPQICNEAIGCLKIDYLEKNNPFTNNFALIIYSVEAGGNTEFIMVKMEHGHVKDENAQDLLLRGHRKIFGELRDDFNRFKIYEESEHTPIEYVMLILWTSIFPEIMKKGDIDRIIEWKNRRETIFGVKLDDLVEYLHKMYTLSSLTGNERKQFRRRIVREAMKKFEGIGYAKEISTDDEVKFEVTYKTLSGKDEVYSLLKALYLKTDERIEVHRVIPDTNLTKWIP